MLTKKKVQSRNKKKKTWKTKTKENCATDLRQVKKKIEKSLLFTRYHIEAAARLGRTEEGGSPRRKLARRKTFVSSRAEPAICCGIALGLGWGSHEQMSRWLAADLYKVNGMACVGCCQALLRLMVVLKMTTLTSRVGPTVIEAKSSLQWVMMMLLGWVNDEWCHSWCINYGI